MAGVSTSGELTETRSARVRFALATTADDGEILRLLRDNPMAGRMSLSLERDPSYFAEERYLAEERKTIVAFEGERLVCVGSCSVRRRFLNGTAQRVGYLGGLRLDANASGRFDILRRGYRFFRETQADQPATFYFTSVAADNERAIRFLERGLPHMPVYEHLADFITATIPVPRFVRPESVIFSQLLPSQLPELTAFLNDCARNHELAPYWTPEELLALSHLGLGLEDFRTVRDASGLIGCAAVWDQRIFKQTVIRDYGPWLGCWRPWLNLLARVVTGQPPLPAVGAVVPMAIISHLATASASAEALATLIKGLFPLARKKQIDFLTVGFAAEDPRWHAIRSSFAVREYRSRLYRVRWPGDGESARALHGHLIFPDVALL
jgi:hypothetical protein